MHAGWHAHVMGPVVLTRVLAVGGGLKVVVVVVGGGSMCGRAHTHNTHTHTHAHSLTHP